MKKKAIIMGAGPAGLTVAYELLQKTDIIPILFEANDLVGGISKTVDYKGNKIDIGGHRFFSKSDIVMKWWENILPIEKHSSYGDGPDPKKEDKIFLIRNRLSRIYFLRKFFKYPISLSSRTLLNLGLLRTFKISIDYIISKLFPIKNEKSLEDFFINRFGKELYKIFFKDYTEKVWGVSCKKIKPEWGAQRIKSLSITKAVLHTIRKKLGGGDTHLSQKETEISLIERFLYPKFGPGQMWEEVAKKIKEKGGEIHLNQEVTEINYNGENIISIKTKCQKTNEIKNIAGDYFFSTIAIKDLINSFDDKVPSSVREIANNLLYRDFITVGLLLKKLIINDKISDNWIYIQESDVKIGRLQVFNNWSPYLVKDSDTIWLGLEYFCNVGDDLWAKKDSDFIDFAIDELVKIGIIKKQDVLDSTILRVEKAYPAYFGSYDQLFKIKDFVNKIENLYLIGRNGLHRYNNQDHSMLTAITAVDNIIKGVKSKDNIWAINIEKDYHESK